MTSDCEKLAVDAALKTRALLLAATAEFHACQPSSGNPGKKMNQARQRYNRLTKEAARWSTKRDAFLDELLVAIGHNAEQEYRKLGI